MLQDLPTSSHECLRPRSADRAIETDRLTLRRPTLADVPAIARLANDRRIAEMTRRLPYPYRKAHAAAFLAMLPLIEAQDCSRVHLIEHLGEPIGVVSLEGTFETLELGYWLGVSHWGRGFATEAARAALDAAFAASDIAHVAASVRVANPASRSVLEKCGFVWERCTLERFDVLGCSAPADRFRLTRAAWMQSRD